MPTYEFEDQHGQRVEMFLTMAEAPGYGAWVELGGRKMRRVVERNVTAPIVTNWVTVNRSQPRWDPTAPRHDEFGNGVLLTKKEHDDYQAKHEHLAWE